MQLGANTQEAASEFIELGTLELALVGGGVAVVTLD